MPKPWELYIVGAGGLGREVLAWLHAIPCASRNWELKGFLDSRSDVFKDYDIRVPLISDPLEFRFSGREHVICAVGDPNDKIKYCELLMQKGAAFLSLIHPSARVSSSAVIGQGCIMATDSMVGPGARLGSFTTVLGSTSIGVDASIGTGTTISAFSSVGHGASLGRGVFLGSHSVVMPGTTVGDFARIGARTVVSGSIPSGSTYFGIPSKIIWTGNSLPKNQPTSQE